MSQMKSCRTLAPSRTRCLLCAFVLMVLATALAIADVVPVLESDLPVNTTTDGGQVLGAGLNDNDRVAADATGKFGVVWQGGADLQSTDVYVRLFDANGTPRTGEIVVNTTLAGPQQNPMIAMADNGQFVVTWSETKDKQVKARLFNSSGSPLTGEINVSAKGNAKTSYGNTSVAMDADGDFVLAYAKWATTSASYLFQRYNSAGAAQGKATVAGTTGLGNAVATLDMADDGRFVLVTHDFCQRYSASGAKVGPQIIYEDASSQGFNADVAVAADGKFVIAWPSSSGTGGYWAQTFNADGSRAVTNNFQLTTRGGGSNVAPSVAIDDLNGEIVLIRRGTSVPPGSVVILASRSDFTGNALAAEFQVNTTTQAAYGQPIIASVTETVNGGFVAVWEHKPSEDVSDVLGQVYAASP